MKSIINYFTFILIIIILLPFINGCNSKENSKIKVGIILPLTGSLSSYGIEGKNALFFLPNDKYEYILEDSKGDPKTAVSAFNKLISVDKVAFVVGDMLSNTTLAIAPVANSNRVITISPTASSKDIPKEGGFVYSIFPNEEYEGQFMAKYAFEKNFNNVGIFFEKVPAAETMGISFKSEMEELGGRIVFLESYNSDTKDYRSLINKYKNSSIDALYIISYPEPAKLLIKQLRENKWNIPLLSQSGLFDQKFIEEVNPFAEGMVLSGSYFNNMVNDSLIKNFIKIYYGKYNEEPSQFAAHTYDAFFVAEMLYELNQTKNFSVSDALMQINYKGLTGNIVFDKKGTVNKKMSLFIVKGKDFELIK